MYHTRILEEVLGSTISKINVSEYDIGFDMADGRRFIMTHHQDCCESVYVEDICGDTHDLLHHPLLEAEEVSFNEANELPEQERMWMTLQSNNTFEPSDDSCTWTFYKFSTIKGSVTIRWNGSSNGYYSERVDFDELTGE